jgi:hypothetical protein
MKSQHDSLSFQLRNKYFCVLLIYGTIGSLYTVLLFLHNETIESRVLILKSDVKHLKTFGTYSRQNLLTVCNAIYMVENFVYLKTVK